MPEKIIKEATGKKSQSVVGECIIENVKDKHKNRVSPLEWDSETKQGTQKTKIC